MAVQGLLAVPNDAGDSGAGDILQAEGKGRSGTGEIAFSQGEDAALRVAGVRREEEPGAGGADDADAAQTPVEGTGAGGLGRWRTATMAAPLRSAEAFNAAMA